MNPDEVDVWIIDSSALVKAKTIVAVNRQWASFKHLEQMVIEGRIALPRQATTRGEDTGPIEMGGCDGGCRCGRCL